jgi:hypothetical protein
VLVLTLRRRSFALAIAAALALSPIVWLHFFAMLVLPLAVSFPRFRWVWLLPLPLFAAPGTLNGAAWQTALVLGIAACTIAVCEYPPLADLRRRRSAASSTQLPAERAA